MDGSNIVHGQVPSMSSPRRPRTQQSSHFRHLPIIKDSRDYIMITQEILDAFRERVVKSHKVNLKLNPVRLKSSRRQFVGRRHLPPMFSERADVFHAKAHTSFDLHEQVRHRPVKVFVDDITKNSASTSEAMSGSGQDHTHDILKRKSTSVKAQIKKADSVVKRMHRLRRHSFCMLSAVPFIEEDKKSVARSMESGDEDGGVPDDIIERVARANTMHISHAPVLPEIRAAPCPIHVKQNKGRPTEESQEYFSGHIKDIKTQKKNRQTHPIRSITIQQNSPSQGNGTKNRVDINVRIPEQFPTHKPPALPKHMSSQDYVMTWLIHGSAPPGSNHFPEIIPSQVKTKAKTKITPRNSNTNE